MVDFADRYYVTFTSSNGLSVRALLDEASPVLSGGANGWEVVDRPKRVGMTRYKGVDPFSQEITVRFEGVADKIDQEPYISDLWRMSEAGSELQEPPRVSVAGLARRTDLTYVIQNINESNQGVIWDMQGGSPVRLRQVITVSLLQFVDDQVITTQPTPAVVSKSDTTPAKQISAPDNATLTSLAIKYFGDPSKWYDIWLVNIFLLQDPRALIDKGTLVFIPGKTIVRVP